MNRLMLSRTLVVLALAPITTGGMTHRIFSRDTFFMETAYYWGIRGAKQTYLFYSLIVKSFVKRQRKQKPSLHFQLPVTFMMKDNLNVRF